MDAIDTAARYTLGGIMSGTLNLMMYIPLVIVIAVIAFLLLGMALPYHVPVANYRQDLPMQNN